MDHSAGPSRPRRSSSLDARKLRSSDDLDQVEEDPPHYDEPSRASSAEEALLNNGKAYSENGFPPQSSRRTSEDLEQTKNHLASIEQKKALWWRNVIITGMFIVSW